MAATNVISKVRVDRVGRESTFGTKAGTMTACFPIARPEIELTQEQLARTDERARPHAHVAPVQGFKSGTAPFSFNFRAPATQLTDGATPPADTPAGLLMLEGALGGKTSLAAGGVVGSSATTTSVPLGAGQGANFAIGEVCIVYVASVPVPALITNISTDTLTVWPTLPGSPASGQKVYKCYGYYHDTSIPSLSIDSAIVGDSTLQTEMLGCVVTGLEVSTEIGKIPTYKATAKAATYNGPANLSLSTAYVADPDGAAYYVNASSSVGMNLLQASSTNTRTSYIIEKAAIKVEPGTDHIPGIGGGVQGKVGAMRTDPKRPAATISLQVRTDTSWDAIYTAQTPLCFFHASSTGSGASMRWFIVLTWFVLTKPVGIGGVDGERGVMMLEGECIENPLSSANASTALATAPLVIAVC